MGVSAMEVTAVDGFPFPPRSATVRIGTDPGMNACGEITPPWLKSFCLTFTVT